MSRTMAVVLGVVFIAVGCVVMLAGAGVLPTNTPADVLEARWVIVVAGLAFVFCGAAVINGFAVADGVGPDGDLPASTPFASGWCSTVVGSALSAHLPPFSVGWQVSRRASLFRHGFVASDNPPLRASCILGPAGFWSGRSAALARPGWLRHHRCSSSVAEALLKPLRQRIFYCCR